MFLYVLLYRDVKVLRCRTFSPSLVKIYYISHVDWWKENTYRNELAMLAHELAMLALAMLAHCLHILLSGLLTMTLLSLYRLS